MSWQGVQGHDRVVERFQHAAQLGRLGNAYLLTGPSGIGKRLLAHKLAAALLCPHAGSELIPCGDCASCRPLRSGAHPDLLSVACPPDRQTIPLETLIGDRSHRAKEGLCYWINLAPVLAQRKVAIIEDADALAEEGANSLLKTLEEPPPGSVLLLVSHNLQRQLPTIRSRCQIVFCRPLPTETLAELIAAEGLADSRDRASELARLSSGSLDNAREFADPAWTDFLTHLHQRLDESPRDGVALAKEVVEFVDEAGTSAPPRRARLAQILRLVADRLRRELRQVATSPVEEAFDQQRETLRQLDHTLDSLQQINANAHLVTLITAWAEAMAGESTLQVTTTAR